MSPLNDPMEKHDSFNFSEWGKYHHFTLPILLLYIYSLFGGKSSNRRADDEGEEEGELVENCSPDIWGVLLSLSPKEYDTVQLSSPKRLPTTTTTTITTNNESSGNDGGGDKELVKPFGYTIGRHRNCDIRVINPHISNRHCIIYKITTSTSNIKSHTTNRSSGESRDVVYIEDTSTNGTHINGKRIQKNKPYRLKDGDTIQLAKYIPKSGVKPFNDQFYMFQDLSYHRRQSKSNNNNKTGNGNDGSEKPFSRFHQNYLLGKSLGKGAFAQVKEGINRLTGQRFAIKMIDRNRISSTKTNNNNNNGGGDDNKKDKVTSNFEAETSILLRIRHPNVVQIYGVYQEDDYFYLVLDLAHGGELFDEIIRCQYFDEDQVRVIMLQLLLAIRYLNKRDIVHRDIKPENILLADPPPSQNTSVSSSSSKANNNNDTTKKGKRWYHRIKLADFGLAKIVADRVFMKTVCGTPMYVAPEVLKAKLLGKYDKQVDMWSLGVVLYICLCGFPPFSDEIAPPPLKQQIINGIYSFPSPNWDSISDGAKDLVESMLVVDPKLRITVDEALKHPWLKAVPVPGGGGGVWKIDGVDGFDVIDPEVVVTGSSGTESQTQSNSIGSPTSQQQQLQLQQGVGGCLPSSCSSGNTNNSIGIVTPIKNNNNSSGNRRQHGRPGGGNLNSVTPISIHKNKLANTTPQHPPPPPKFTIPFTSPLQKKNLKHNLHKGPGEDDDEKPMLMMVDGGDEQDDEINSNNNNPHQYEQASSESGEVIEYSRYLTSPSPPHPSRINLKTKIGRGGPIINKHLIHNNRARENPSNSSGLNHAPPPSTATTATNTSTNININSTGSIKRRKVNNDGVVRRKENINFGSNNATGMGDDIGGVSSGYSRFKQPQQKEDQPSEELIFDMSMSNANSESPSSLANNNDCAHFQPQQNKVRMVVGRKENNIPNVNPNTTTATRTGMG
ncbi:serine/threonine protein kinase, partial [Mycoemilia scoparia]